MSGSDDRPVATVFSRLDRFFATRSRNAILVICLILALIIGGMDVHGVTGLLIVYLAPIALAAWYGGGRVGVVIAIYCSAAWFVAGEIATGFRDVDTVALGSFLARLAIFLVMTQVIARLRESMRLQNELTQFIVHDLRSPISSSITGLMTLQQSGTHLDEFEKEMVSLALVSNQRALTLVNSMLDVSKLATGKIAMNVQHVSIEDLVSESIQQVALWANSEEIQIVSDINVANGLVDRDITVRVLVNLLSNALKFSPRGSEIRVGVTSQSNGLRFVVEDHGPGIPAEYVQTIFEPFGQVRGTKGGTGLGLTFCRLAVQAQGGRIWAESVVGKGTKMIFTIHAHEVTESGVATLAGEGGSS
jgi:signal transduction histidine kinase